MTTLRTTLKKLNPDTSDYTTRVKNVFRGRAKKFAGRTLEEKLTEQNVEVFAHIFVAQILYGTEWPMPYLQNVKDVLKDNIGKYVKFVKHSKIFLDIQFTDNLIGESVGVKYLAYHNAPWWNPIQVRCNKDREGRMVGLPIYCDKDFTEHSVMGDLAHIRYITHVSFRDPVKHNFGVVLELDYVETTNLSIH